MGNVTAFCGTCHESIRRPAQRLYVTSLILHQLILMNVHYRQRVLNSFPVTVWPVSYARVSIFRYKESYVTGSPLTAVQAATAAYSCYHCRQVGHIHYQTLGLPSCSTNPHRSIFLHYVMGWHSCGHLLQPILTAAPLHLVFQPSFPQALPQLCYNPRHLVFKTRFLMHSHG
jgi:hypothetical protein